MALRIVVFIIWLGLLLGIAYLIRDAYRRNHPNVAVTLIPILSALTALFVVFAATVFGIDLKQVKDFFHTGGGGGPPTNGTTTNG